MRDGLGHSCYQPGDDSVIPYFLDHENPHAQLRPGCEACSQSEKMAPEIRFDSEEEPGVLFVHAELPLCFRNPCSSFS